MTLTTILVAWLALNYALMARLAYVGMRRDGEGAQAALLQALVWPIRLLPPRLV